MNQQTPTEPHEEDDSQSKRRKLFGTNGKIDHSAAHANRLTNVGLKAMDDAIITMVQEETKKSVTDVMALITGNKGHEDFM